MCNLKEKFIIALVIENDIYFQTFYFLQKQHSFKNGSSI